jgi:ribosomal protein S27E
MREAIQTIIPHAEFGAPACRGCLAGIEDDGMGEIVCSLCGAVITHVIPPGGLAEILNEWMTLLVSPAGRRRTTSPGPNSQQGYAATAAI